MSLLSPQLQAFVAVVETKTVHGAAKVLGLTQTGITQRIRTLESSLSANLFTRSRRGMFPTPEGEALYCYCMGARDLEGEALAKIQKPGLASQVRISLSGPSSMIRARVIPSLQKTMREYPDLLITLDVKDTGNPALDLIGGRVHLAIVHREEVVREMDSKLLAPQQYVLVGPKNWRNRSVEEIVENERIVDFDPSDQMTYDYLKTFNLFDRAKKSRFFVNNTDALAHWVRLGAGYTVLTTEFFDLLYFSKDLHIFHPDKIFVNQIALAWYPRPQMPGYFSDLIKAIR